MNIVDGQITSWMDKSLCDHDIIKNKMCMYFID